MIIGLGASSANVIEHFHGVPFNPTLARMRETVQIINMLMADEPLNYKGKSSTSSAASPCASTRCGPTSRSTSPLSGRAHQGRGRNRRRLDPDDDPDGQDAERDRAFRDRSAPPAATRTPITVIAPGRVAVVTKDVEKRRQAAQANLAFYIARMGDYYYQQLCDMGYAEDCNAIRVAWESGGSEAGYAAVSDRLLDSLWCVTSSVEEARERLEEQEAAGIDMHSVLVRDTSPTSRRGASTRRC